MEFESTKVGQLVGSIWEAVLSLPIEPADERPALTPAPARSTAACVQITGTWSGAVLLDCSAEAARAAATAMFGMETSSVSPCEQQDAVAELVNMIGGNLKALLPEGCFLSLPAVMEGGDLCSRVPGSRLAGRYRFRCQGYDVAVTIREKLKGVSVAAA